ncbi:MAG: Zn-ribbon domain-containing OB-fold protein [Caldisphaeraceae archaeon]|nr:Zn-ribbon domain-containing OB-fold protein [Caldisphaeraceae archaeon]
MKEVPGIGLKSSEMYSLIGLLEDRPKARYDFSAGPTVSKFLLGLKEGKILGKKCPRCGRIFVPPRSYCEWCHVATSEWVEVPQTGIIHTAVVSYISAKRQRLEKPEVVGIVRLDVPGYRDKEYEFAGLFHRICIDPKLVVIGEAIGMRVKVRWKPKEERKASILDIECFEPVR